MEAKDDKEGTHKSESFSGKRGKIQHSLYLFFYKSVAGGNSNPSQVELHWLVGILCGQHKAVHHFEANREEFLFLKSFFFKIKPEKCGMDSYSTPFTMIPLNTIKQNKLAAIGVAMVVDVGVLTPTLFHQFCSINVRCCICSPDPSTQTNENTYFQR